MSLPKDPKEFDRSPRTTKEIDRAIGQRINAVRRIQGVSIEAAANRLGLNAPEVAQIENGERRATATMLFQLSDLLNVPISSFYEGI